MDDDFDEFLKELPSVNQTDVKDLSGSDRNMFIDTVFQDYEFTIEKRMNPKVIRYYRDVLVKLIKTYGH